MNDDATTETRQDPEDAQDGEPPKKPQTALLAGAIPAIFGLIGGVVSGGLTAYVQLSTKREQYSIERAREFKSLLNELNNEETSRLAVLNLWQLYRDERDRRIITAAAFAVNQPDLVEIISGIDDELTPVADMLQVRALSSDRSLREPALQTLINVDPVRAAGLLLDHLSEDIAANDGRMRSYSPAGFDPLRELVRLARQDDTVHQMVVDAAEAEQELLFEYVLYRAGRSSDFVRILEAAYAQERLDDRSPVELKIANDYMRLSNFNAVDRERLVMAAGAYIRAALATGDSEVFNIVDALSALKNSEFRISIQSALSGEVAEAFQAAIVSDDQPDILRARALEVLRVVSPREAIIALVQAKVNGQPGEKLNRAILEIATSGVIEQVQATDAEFSTPDCEAGSIVDCMEADAERWRAWLRKQGAD